jgi:hypothetical protein
MHLTTTWEIAIRAIPAAIIIFSGYAKLTGHKQVIDTLTKVGVIEYSKLLGIAEIIFAILFVYPPTNPIGFIMLVCYFSGALATDLSHKNKIVAPVVFLVILFVVEVITNREMFV